MSLCPLVVDLDGTLLDSDMLVESGLAFVRAEPLRALLPVYWLLSSGKAQLKARIADRVEVDVARLPYNKAVLDFVAEERKRGRETILATASHLAYAEQIADHLQLFDRVMGSDGLTNLSSTRKAERLLADFGEKGFDYVGNSSADLPVWRHARRAYVVNPEAGVEKRARALGNVEKVLLTQPHPFRMWAKALRFHQWMKNLLVFVPLLASHQVGNAGLLLQGLLAFFVFGLCASSVYVLNDLLDLADDRHHPTKRHRPFASGRLPLLSGILAAPLLLVAAMGGAFLLLPLEFALTLVCYYLLTLAYSVVLKRVMMVDVITLGMLYTLRIIAGAFALGLSLTFWLLAFSMFIFLSLALVKRYAELRYARRDGLSSKARGRGYYPGDLEMISSLGASSGYLAVMVLALYIQDKTTVEMYRHPTLIWLSCPLLLFWVSRTWMLTHRGEMHEDPVVFAVKDRISLMVGGLFAIIFWAAK